MLPFEIKLFKIRWMLSFLKWHVFAYLPTAWILFRYLEDTTNKNLVNAAVLLIVFYTPNVGFLVQLLSSILFLVSYIFHFK